MYLSGEEWGCQWGVRYLRGAMYLSGEEWSCQSGVRYLRGAMYLSGEEWSCQWGVRYLQGVDIGSSSFSWWEIVVSVSWSCADISDDDDTVAAAGRQLWRSCTSRLIDWCKPLNNTRQTVAWNLARLQRDVLINSKQQMCWPHVLTYKCISPLLMIWCHDWYYIKVMSQNIHTYSCDLFDSELVIALCVLFELYILTMLPTVWIWGQPSATKLTILTAQVFVMSDCWHGELAEIAAELAQSVSKWWQLAGQSPTGTGYTYP